jgi:hypothetical protein
MIRRLEGLIVFVLLVLSPMAMAQVDDTDAARLAARFAHLAGSDENAMALVLALHSASAVRLATERGGRLPEMISLVPPTPPMPWNEVRITLLNVQDLLVRARILKPTLEQLHAALVGGELDHPQGGRLPVRGVLQMRAEGLSWMDVARSTAPLPGMRAVSGAP